MGCACACLCVCGAGGAGAALAASAAVCRRAAGGAERGALPAGLRALPAAAQPAHLHFPNEPLDGRQRRQPPGPAATLAEPRRPRGAGDGQVPAAGGRAGRCPRNFAPGGGRGAGARHGEGRRGAPSPAGSRRSRAGSAVPPPAPPPPAALPGGRDRSELLAVNNKRPPLLLPFALRKQLIMH